MTTATAAPGFTPAPDGIAEDLRLQFREAMAHLDAAVNVVTSDGPGDQVGLAATATCDLTASIQWSQYGG